jgi:hypothetical protein
LTKANHVVSKKGSRENAEDGLRSGSAITIACRGAVPSNTQQMPVKLTSGLARGPTVRTEIAMNGYAQRTTDTWSHDILSDIFCGWHDHLVFLKEPIWARFVLPEYAEQGITGHGRSAVGCSQVR